jgi:hypothetical protein
MSFEFHSMLGGSDGRDASTQSVDQSHAAV